MAIGDSLHAFLSQPRITGRLASDVAFRNCYDAVVQIAAGHSLDPLVLNEDECSTGHILSLIRSSRRGYCLVQFPSTLQTDSLLDRCSIGSHFGVQLINPRTAQASWMDSESTAAATVGEARETGRQLDTILGSVYQLVQDAWGVALDYPCFVEALRYQMHSFSSSKLHTAYFHSIKLSDRANGPTLVQVQMPR